MIRRNRGQESSSGVTTPSSPFRKNAASASVGSSSRKDNEASGVSATVLLIIAAVLTIITYSYPSSPGGISEVDYVTNGVYQTEQKVAHWWHGNSDASSTASAMTPEQIAESKRQATARMTQQDSTWVDGEKKLKIKLKVLAERQSRGLDLGVPTLTRYLGEDIPAWPDETMDEVTWRQKVTDKYAEMREEEKEWRKNVQAFMDQEENNHG